MRRARALVLALLVGPAAGPLLAQATDQVCRPLEQPRVGGWAEYRLRTPDGDSTVVRMAIVGRVTAEGRAHVWQESVMRAGGATTVIQSLVAADPYDPTAIARAIIHAPERPPMELPATALAMMRRSGGQGPTGIEACRSGEPVGWETITVPAGEIRALHIRYQRDGRSADSWLAPGIPFATVRTLVTAEAPAGVIELVLLAHGTDARPTKPLDGIP